ncbi:MAG: hypothetical protein JSU67_18590, partial [Gammaproteobacteria bacterium]
DLRSPSLPGEGLLSHKQTLIGPHQASTIGQGRKLLIGRTLLMADMLHQLDSSLLRCHILQALAEQYAHIR